MNDLVVWSFFQKLHPFSWKCFQKKWIVHLQVLALQPLPLKHACLFFCKSNKRAKSFYLQASFLALALFASIICFWGTPELRTTRYCIKNYSAHDAFWTTVSGFQVSEVSKAHAILHFFILRATFMLKFMIFIRIWGIKIPKIEVLCAVNRGFWSKIM